MNKRTVKKHRFIPNRGPQLDPWIIRELLDNNIEPDSVIKFTIRYDEMSHTFPTNVTYMNGMAVTKTIYIPMTNILYTKL